MSAFHGPQGPGAMRRHRDEKRAAAEEHARHTKPSHTKAIRLGGCPSRKVRYADEGEARRELVGCVVAKNRGKHQRLEQRVYACAMCGGYHLTSKEGRAA